MEQINKPIKDRQITPTLTVTMLIQKTYDRLIKEGDYYICPLMSYVIGSHSTDVISIHDILPELAEYKPKHRYLAKTWWEHDNLTNRLNTLYDLSIRLGYELNHKSAIDDLADNINVIMKYPLKSRVKALRKLAPEIKMIRDHILMYSYDQTVINEINSIKSKLDKPWNR